MSNTTQWMSQDAAENCTFDRPTKSDQQCSKQCISLSNWLVPKRWSRYQRHCWIEWRTTGEVCKKGCLESWNRRPMFLKKSKLHHLCTKHELICSRYRTCTVLQVFQWGRGFLHVRSCRCQGWVDFCYPDAKKKNRIYCKMYVCTVYLPRLYPCTLPTAPVSRSFGLRSSHEIDILDTDQRPRNKSLREPIDSRIPRTTRGPLTGYGSIGSIGGTTRISILGHAVPRLRSRVPPIVLSLCGGGWSYWYAASKHVRQSIYGCHLNFKLK